MKLFSRTAALLLLVLVPGVRAQDSLNVRQLGFLPLESPNWVADIWGYADSTGEYALVCIGHAGLAVVDVTDPTEPELASIVSAQGSDLKDVKTYGHYALAVHEGGPLMVIDLSDPWEARQAATYNQTFSGAHNLFIEGHYAYVVGTHNPAAGGINILDISDPESPVEVGSYDEAYVHDVYVRNDTAYASEYYRGSMAIIDVTDKAAPRVITRISYPRAATHSGWLTEDGDYMLTTDETRGGHLNIWDISNLDQIERVAEYESSPGISIHNVHVKGQYAYISYYQDWLRILDLSDPTNPVEVGVYDNTPANDAGLYSNFWGVYPYGPSGIVYASHMTDGLYLYDFMLTAGPTITHMPLADTEDTTGPYGVVFSLEDEDGVMTDSVVVFYRTSPGVDYTVLHAVGLGKGTFQAQIPGQTNFTQVEYYIRAVDQLGNARKHPLPAPMVTHKFMVGPDQTAPRIMVEDRASIFNPRYPLRVEIEDNSGRLDAERTKLFYRRPGGQWEEGEMSATGEHGEFKARLGGDVNVGETVEYRVETYDLASDPNAAVTEVRQLQVGFEGFEHGMDEWVTSGSWGVEPLFFHSGEYSLNDCPGTSYANLVEDTVAIAEPLDLSNLEAATLRFWTMYFLEQDKDFVYIEASADAGQTWTLLGDAFTGIDQEWDAEERDLSSFAGEARVNLRFRISTDRSQAYDFVGWFIDDMEIVSGMPTGSRDGGEGTTPTAFALGAAYPNPVQSSFGGLGATIPFTVGAASDVSLEVYNVLGQRVRRLMDVKLPAGEHAARWDFTDDAGQRVSPGVYLVRFVSPAFQGVRKIMLIK